MLPRKIAVLLVALLFPLPLAAEMLTFELDPTATRVEIGFGATLHHVDGSLRVKEGQIRFDPETGQASGRIVIDATSATTGVVRRDRKMHEKILESAKYPDIVFTVERMSGAIHRTGRSDMEIHGTLDMHGVQKPVDVLATAVVDGDRVKATGHLTVPYREWGMADPSFFILRVEKEVHVQLKVTGRLTGAPPPAATPPPRRI